MPTLSDCLELVASARKSARDPESAYVLRTRLNRSLLAVARLAASQAGVARPIMPDDIATLAAEDPWASQTLRICASLVAKTHSLCQPSEALDSRWRSGWPAIDDDLRLLEVSLQAMEACTPKARHEESGCA